MTQLGVESLLYLNNSSNFHPQDETRSLESLVVSDNDVINRDRNQDLDEKVLFPPSH